MVQVEVVDVGHKSIGRERRREVEDHGTKSNLKVLWYVILGISWKLEKLSTS